MSIDKLPSRQKELEPWKWVEESKANEIQHGGDHYKRFKGHEPWDVITAWNLGYLDGTALKYIARWRYKNGIEDLKKAIHFLQKTIEVEEANAKQASNRRPAA
jgi:hypothetical protein